MNGINDGQGLGTAMGTNGNQRDREQWEFVGYVRASLGNINESVRYIRESVDELRTDLSHLKARVAGWSALFGSIGAILMVGITKLLGG